MNALTPNWRLELTSDCDALVSDGERDVHTAEAPPERARASKTRR